MRLLGVSALILTVLSFLFWLITWVYWTFLTIPLGYNVPLGQIVRGISFLGYLCQTLALVLVSIALMILAKHFPKTK